MLGRAAARIARARRRPRAIRSESRSASSAGRHIWRRLSNVAELRRGCRLPRRGRWCADRRCRRPSAARSSSGRARCRSAGRICMMVRASRSQVAHRSAWPRAIWPSTSMPARKSFLAKAASASRRSCSTVLAGVPASALICASSANALWFKSLSVNGLSAAFAENETAAKQTAANTATQAARHCAIMGNFPPKVLKSRPCYGEFELSNHVEVVAESLPAAGEHLATVRRWVDGLGRRGPAPGWRARGIYCVLGAELLYRIAAGWPRSSGDRATAF